MNRGEPAVSTDINENTPLVLAAPAVKLPAAEGMPTPPLDGMGNMRLHSAGGTAGFEGAEGTNTEEARTPLLEEGDNNSSSEGGGDGGRGGGASLAGESRSVSGRRPDVADGELDQADVVYSANSFMAVVKPVTVTMTLSAAITFSLYADAAGATNSALSIYEVYDESTTLDPSSVRLGKSLVNAFIIVLVLAAATVVIVLMYWMRCMKCLWGYMAMSSAVLLGLIGGAVWGSALEVFQLPCDGFTYYGVLWNFAVVGVVAIFYQKGIPTVVTQGYLVATSIIMAWQLSRFDEWTGWCLLVVLALYDLCAVLTPCGPLKALVHLMQEYEEPMPGLLYEAELPAGPPRRRPSRRRGNRRNNGRRQSPSAEGLAEEHEHQQQHPEEEETLPSSGGDVDGDNVVGMSAPTNRGGVAGAAGRIAGQHEEPAGRGGHSGNSEASASAESRPCAENTEGDQLSLELVEPCGISQRVGEGRVSGTGSNSSSPSARGSTAVGSPRSLSASHGSRGETGMRKGGRRRLGSGLGNTGEQNEEEEAFIGTREAGRRTLPSRSEDVDEAEARAGRTTVDHSTAQDVEEEGASIKLGLGDFVFYSVLVSKAALYSFTAWAVCVVVIVFGLGATLVLLAVHRMALPALPISVGLGTAFYLLTRFSMQPYVEALNETPLYF